MNDATLSNIPTNIAPTPSAGPATATNPALSATTASPSSSVTPGWKTSEFWMTAIGQVGLVLAAASGALPTKYAVLAGALSQVAYSVSRGLAKAGAASAY